MKIQIAGLSEGLHQYQFLEKARDLGLSDEFAGELKVDLCGSYETGFNENDDNQRQWPIPNVIGVSPR